MHNDAQFVCYVKKYMDMVFRVAFNMLGSRAEAEDAAQNVFLKLYRSGKPFESEEHVKHWLIRVAINESKRAAASPWRRMEPLEGADLASFEFPGPEQAGLMEAVLRLKPKYRAAIYLHYYEGLSAEELSAALGIPKATALTHLRRGREALKKLLTEDERSAR